MKPNDIIEILFCYQWDTLHKENGKAENEESEAALKKIKEFIQNSFSTNSTRLSVRRLRASAGGFLHETIVKRLLSAKIVVFDISNNNPNVWIELGMAFVTKHSLNKSLQIYIIKYKSNNKEDIYLPSDLQGYFLTHYDCDENARVTFCDNGSFLNSLRSDVSTLMSSKENSVA